MIDPVGAWEAGSAIARFRALTDDDATQGAAALLADAEWTASVLAAPLADPAAAWRFAARRTASRSSLTLARTPAAALTVASIGDEAEQASAVAGGRLVIARVLAGIGDVERRAAGRVAPAFTAASARPLGTARRQRFVPGDVLRLDGRREAWRIRPTGEPVVLLLVTVENDAAPVIREYGADGVLVRVAASDGAPARALMLTAMLDALPLADAAAGYAAASGHPAFFVRWQAMRDWLARDRAQAAPRLASLADADPHPEVRAAARAVLERRAACPG